MKRFTNIDDRPTKEHVKAAHERNVFDEFCAVARLKVESARTGDANQREPDIIANLGDNTGAAFELVRLDDPKMLRRRKQMFPSQKLALAKLRQLPPERREGIAKNYSDAIVSLPLTHMLRTREKVELIDATLAAMYDNPIAAGRLFRKADDFDDEPDLSRFVWIHRAAKFIDGPRFSCSSGGSVEPLQLHEITGKLQRTTYNTALPLYVLAYSDVMGEIAEGAEREELARVCAAGLADSMFSGVWVFESLQQRATLYPR